jgi:ABC-2 type transport system ATP-binding protein
VSAGAQAADRVRESVEDAPQSAQPVVVAERVVRRFGAVTALAGVSLGIDAGEIHALVGPNGAGKTTLLRVLTGLVAADEGRVRILDVDPGRSPQQAHRHVGVVTSGPRSFYLRISGFENLLFFARLHGLRRRAAAERARELLVSVGLRDAAGRAVRTYSTGMQRRLAIARALLPDPTVLLIDEATHDLDPHASARVRQLIADAAGRGAAVLWATQRLEEIKGFARSVTMLDGGAVRFAGSVPRLLRHAVRDQYLLRLAGGRRAPRQLVRHGVVVATLAANELDDEHYTLTLRPGAILGDALEALGGYGVRILGCTESRPSVEDAFMALLEDDAT